MRRSLLALVFLASSVTGSGLAACGGSAAPGTEASSGEASKALGPAGGTVSTSEGASLDFSSGALSKTTTITIAASAASPVPTHATAVGTPYVFGPEGTVFAVPVLVTLPFDATSLPTGKTAADVAIYTAPVGSMAFTRLATTVVDSSHVSAETLHFSVFVPVVTDGVDAGIARDASRGGCATDSDCPSGELCEGDVCVVSGETDASTGGCTNDSQCPTGEACRGNVCVGGGGVDASVGGCASDSDCAGDEVCIDGVCTVSALDAGAAHDAADADADADAEACTAGTTLCGTECVDLSTSPDNCGECRMECPTGESCTEGRCAP